MENQKGTQPKIQFTRSDLKKIAQGKLEMVENVYPIFSFHIGCPKCHHCINVEFSSVELEKVKRKGKKK